jgi:hypothetical protein
VIVTDSILFFDQKNQPITRNRIRHRKSKKDFHPVKDDLFKF